MSLFAKTLGDDTWMQMPFPAVPCRLRKTPCCHVKSCLQFPPFHDELFVGEQLKHSAMSPIIRHVHDTLSLRAQNVLENVDISFCAVYRGIQEELLFEGWLNIFRLFLATLERTYLCPCTRIHLGFLPFRVLQNV